MEELVKKLNYHTKLFDLGEPEISDQEWDNMYFELVQKEKETGTTLPNSPTQKISYEIVTELDKVTHSHPMLSLAKTKDDNEIKAFIGKSEGITMLKLDGLTCSLTYENGLLIQAETRGNGLVGENILHNARHTKGVPNRISTLGRVVVDGEILCTFADFESFKEEYANPRNFAAGSIRLLDSKESSKRALTFVAWDMIEGEEFSTLSDKLTELDKLGFIVVPWSAEDWDVAKNKLSAQTEYPTDGLVVKFNNCTEFDSKGKTSHHFSGGLAFKFSETVETTTLLDVEWSMGRSGQLTPVAIFEPVDLDGSTITRASLHNISIMKELNIICPGQEIEVFKANEIIPQIKSAKTPDVIKNSFEIPVLCPMCGRPTIITKSNSTETLGCSNIDCEGQLVNKIAHYGDMKKGMAIKGLSKMTIEKLIDWGWLNSISDLYNLHSYKKEWSLKPGFGTVSVNKLLAAIEESKTRNVVDFICALGIPLIGRTASKAIGEQIIWFSDLEELARSHFNFEQWANFGHEMKHALWNFDYSEATELDENVLSLERANVAQEKLEATLEGITFCVTGKVTRYKNRDELSAAIVARGGKVTGSVSSNTNYLVNNDVESTSAKNKKAKELGIEILTEEDLKNNFDI